MSFRNGTQILKSLKVAPLLVALMMPGAAFAESGADGYSGQLAGIREQQHDIDKQIKTLTKEQKEKKRNCDSLSGEADIDQDPGLVDLNGVCDCDIGQGLCVEKDFAGVQLRVTTDAKGIVTVQGTPEGSCYALFLANRSLDRVQSSCATAVKGCSRVKREKARVVCARENNAMIAAIAELKDQKKELISDLRDLQRSCPNCAQMEAMKPREPGIGDYLIGGLQAITPMVMGGMNMISYNNGLNNYTQNYGAYLSQCAQVGVPCGSPMMGGGGGGFGMGGYGMGGGGMGGYGMSGGGMGMGGFVVGGGFGAVMGGMGMGGGGYGGGYGQMPGGMGMGMGGFVVGGGFGAVMGGMGMGGGMGMYPQSPMFTGGYGMPAYPYGTGFGSPMFPMGAYGSMQGAGMGGFAVGGGFGAVIGGMGMGGGGGYGGGYGQMQGGMGMGGFAVGGGFGAVIGGMGMGGGGYGGGYGQMQGGMGGYGMGGGYGQMQGGMGGYGMGGGYGQMQGGMGMGGYGMGGIGYGQMQGGMGMGGYGMGGGYGGGGNPQYQAMLQASMQQQMMQSQNSSQASSDLMIAQQQIMEAQQRYYQISSGGGGGYGGIRPL